MQAHIWHRSRAPRPVPTPPTCRLAQGPLAKRSLLPPCDGRSRVEGSIKGATVPQGRYGLTHLEIGGVDVPLTSAQITRGANPQQWDVRADGVPQDMFDSLVNVIGPDVKSAVLAFTDDQGVSHHASCHIVRRSKADPGFNLSTGGLTFSFEGSIK